MTSVRIVCVDFHTSPPTRGLDPLNSEFRGSTVVKVPVLRVFGTTDKGHKACLHIHGVFPYVYVPYDSLDNPNAVSYQMANALDKALNISMGQASSSQQHIYKIELISAFPFYGYHTRQHQFLKISFYNPLMIKKACALLQNGSILGKIFQPHESHIPYHQQFMMDYNLHGMNSLRLSKVQYRTDTSTRDEWIDPACRNDLKKESVCRIEMDGLAEDILNRLEVSQGKVTSNPGIQYICEDEKQRRRNKGVDTQLETCLTQNRIDVAPTITHTTYRKLLQAKLDEKKLSGDSILSDASVYPAEIPDSQSEVSILEDPANNSILEDAELLMEMLRENERERDEPDSILSQTFREIEESDEEQDLTLPLQSVTTPVKVARQEENDDDIWNDSFFDRTLIPQLDGAFDKDGGRNYNLRSRGANKTQPVNLSKHSNHKSNIEGASSSKGEVASNLKNKVDITGNPIKDVEVASKHKNKVVNVALNLKNKVINVAPNLKNKVINDAPNLKNKVINVAPNLKDKVINDAPNLKNKVVNDAPNLKNKSKKGLKLPTKIANFESPIKASQVFPVPNWEDVDLCRSNSQSANNSLKVDLTLSPHKVDVTNEECEFSVVETRQVVQKTGERFYTSEAYIEIDSSEIKRIEYELPTIRDILSEEGSNFTNKIEDASNPRNEGVCNLKNEAKVNLKNKAEVASKLTNKVKINTETKLNEETQVTDIQSHLGGEETDEEEVCRIPMRKAKARKANNAKIAYIEDKETEGESSKVPKGRIANNKNATQKVRERRKAYKANYSEQLDSSEELEAEVIEEPTQNADEAKQLKEIEPRNVREAPVEECSQNAKGRKFNSRKVDCELPKPNEEVTPKISVRRIRERRLPVNIAKGEQDEIPTRKLKGRKANARKDKIVVEEEVPIQTRQGRKAASKVSHVEDTKTKEVLSMDTKNKEGIEEAAGIPELWEDTQTTSTREGRRRRKPNLNNDFIQYTTLDEEQIFGTTRVEESLNIVKEECEEKSNSRNFKKQEVSKRLLSPIITQIEEEECEEESNPRNIKKQEVSKRLLGSVVMQSEEEFSNPRNRRRKEIEEISKPKDRSQEKPHKEITSPKYRRNATQPREETYVKVESSTVPLKKRIRRLITTRELFELEQRAGELTERRHSLSSFNYDQFKALKSQGYDDTINQVVRNEDCGVSEGEETPSSLRSRGYDDAINQVVRNYSLNEDCEVFEGEEAPSSLKSQGYDETINRVVRNYSLNEDCEVSEGEEASSSLKSRGYDETINQVVRNYSLNEDCEVSEGEETFENEARRSKKSEELISTYKYVNKGEEEIRGKEARLSKRLNNGEEQANAPKEEEITGNHIESWKRKLYIKVTQLSEPKRLNERRDCLENFVEESAVSTSKYSDSKTIEDTAIKSRSNPNTNEGPIFKGEDNIEETTKKSRRNLGTKEVEIPESEDEENSESIEERRIPNEGSVDNIKEDKEQENIVNEKINKKLNEENVKRSKKRKSNRNRKQIATQNEVLPTENKVIFGEISKQRKTLTDEADPSLDFYVRCQNKDENKSGDKYEEVRGILKKLRQTKQAETAAQKSAPPEDHFNPELFRVEEPWTADPKWGEYRNKTAPRENRKRKVTFKAETVKSSRAKRPRASSPDSAARVGALLRENSKFTPPESPCSLVKISALTSTFAGLASTFNSTQVNSWGRNLFMDNKNKSSLHDGKEKSSLHNEKSLEKENSSLHNEKSLEKEKSRLDNEKSSLDNEKSSLGEETSCLKRGKSHVAKDKSSLDKNTSNFDKGCFEKDKLSFESNFHRTSHNKDISHIVNDNPTLSKDKLSVAADKTSLGKAKSKIKLVKGYPKLGEDKSGLFKDESSVSKKKSFLGAKESPDKVLSKAKSSLPKEKSSLPKEISSIPKEKSSLPKEKSRVGAENSTVGKEILGKDDVNEEEPNLSEEEASSNDHSSQNEAIELEESQFMIRVNSDVKDVFTEVVMASEASVRTVFGKGPAMVHYNKICSINVFQKVGSENCVGTIGGNFVVLKCRRPRSPERAEKPDSSLSMPLLTEAPPPPPKTRKPRKPKETKADFQSLNQMYTDKVMMQCLDTVISQGGTPKFNCVPKTPDRPKKPKIHVNLLQNILVRKAEENCTVTSRKSAADEVEIQHLLFENQNVPIENENVPVESQNVSVESQNMMVESLEENQPEETPNLAEVSQDLLAAVSVSISARKAKISEEAQRENQNLRSSVEAQNNNSTINLAAKTKKRQNSPKKRQNSPKKKQRSKGRQSLAKKRPKQELVNNNYLNTEVEPRSFEAALLESQNAPPEGKSSVKRRPNKRNPVKSSRSSKDSPPAKPLDSPTTPPKKLVLKRQNRKEWTIHLSTSPKSNRKTPLKSDDSAANLKMRNCAADFFEDIPEKVRKLNHSTPNVVRKSKRTENWVLSPIKAQNKSESVAPSTSQSLNTAETQTTTSRVPALDNQIMRPPTQTPTSSFLRSALTSQIRVPTSSLENQTIHPRTSSHILRCPTSQLTETPTFQKSTPSAIKNLTMRIPNSGLATQTLPNSELQTQPRTPNSERKVKILLLNPPKLETQTSTMRVTFQSPTNKNSIIESFAPKNQSSTTYGAMFAPPTSGVEPQASQRLKPQTSAMFASPTLGSKSQAPATFAPPTSGFKPQTSAMFDPPTSGLKRKSSAASGLKPETLFAPPISGFKPQTSAPTMWSPTRTVQTETTPAACKSTLRAKLSKGIQISALKSPTSQNPSLTTTSTAPVFQQPHTASSTMELETSHCLGISPITQAPPRAVQTPIVTQLETVVMRALTSASQRLQDASPQISQNSGISITPQPPLEAQVMKTPAATRTLAETRVTEAPLEARETPTFSENRLLKITRTTGSETQCCETGMGTPTRETRMRSPTCEMRSCETPLNYSFLSMSSFPNALTLDSMLTSQYVSGINSAVADTTQNNTQISENRINSLNWTPRRSNVSRKGARNNSLDTSGSRASTQTSINESPTRLLTNSTIWVSRDGNSADQGAKQPPVRSLYDSINYEEEQLDYEDWLDLSEDEEEVAPKNLFGATRPLSNEDIEGVLGYTQIDGQVDSSAETKAITERVQGEDEESKNEESYSYTAEQDNSRYSESSSSDEDDADFKRKPRAQIDGQNDSSSEEEEYFPPEDNSKCTSFRMKLQSDGDEDSSPSTEDQSSPLTEGHSSPSVKGEDHSSSEDSSINSADEDVSFKMKAGSEEVDDGKGSVKIPQVDGQNDSSSEDGEMSSPSILSSSSDDEQVNEDKSLKPSSSDVENQEDKLVEEVALSKKKSRNEDSSSDEERTVRKKPRGSPTKYPTLNITVRSPPKSGPFLGAGNRRKATKQKKSQRRAAAKVPVDCDSKSAGGRPSKESAKRQLSFVPQILEETVIEEKVVCHYTPSEQPVKISQNVSGSDDGTKVVVEQGLKITRTDKSVTKELRAISQSDKTVAKAAPQVPPTQSDKSVAKGFKAAAQILQTQSDKSVAKVSQISLTQSDKSVALSQNAVPQNDNNVPIRSKDTKNLSQSLKTPQIPSNDEDNLKIISQKSTKSCDLRDSDLINASPECDINLIAPQLSPESDYNLKISSERSLKSRDSNDSVIKQHSCSLDLDRSKIIFEDPIEEFDQTFTTSFILDTSNHSDDLFHHEELTEAEKYDIASNVAALPGPSRLARQSQASSNEEFTSSIEHAASSSSSGLLTPYQRFQTPESSQSTLNTTQLSLLQETCDFVQPESDGSVFLAPKFNPPSVALIKSTLAKYDLPEVRARDPFYSDAKHVTGNVEVGHSVLKIKSKWDYPDFGSFAELQRERLKKLHGDLDVAKNLNELKLAYCPQDEFVIEPIRRPPSYREAELWLQARKIREELQPKSPVETSLQVILEQSDLFVEQSINNSRQITGIDQTHDFKLSLENLQQARSYVIKQYLTSLVMELHVQTRGDFKPDPQHDAIRALFYSLMDDDGTKLGIIAVNTQNISPGANSGVNILDGTGIDCDVIYVANENELYVKFLELIRIWDPDIFIGYEIEMSSWGYLIDRGYTLGINYITQISRIPDYTPFRQDEESHDLNITGRVVLDLWRLMRHEIALQSYTFENIVYHVLHERAPLYSLRDLTNWWLHRNPKLRRRTVDFYLYRVQRILRIIDNFDLIGRTSELARLFGILFYEVLSRGSQFRVESMMLRLAKPLGFIPVSPSVQQRAKMRAPEYLPLILEPESKFYKDPVIVLDFQSLYPSVIIAYNYCFSTCIGRVEHLGTNSPFEFGATQLKVPRTTVERLLRKNKLNFSPCGAAFVTKDVCHGILPRMLQEILDTRLLVKQSMKDEKGNKVLQRVLHSRQLGLKLIANVTYGYTAANFSGRMPAVEIGDSVVAKGRETLQRAITLVEQNKEWGVRVVYGDTDSMFVLVPGRSREDAFKIGAEIAEAVTNDNPSPIRLKLEKVYQPCILQTKKRYVGFMYESASQAEPEYEAKGIETVRRDGCPAVTKMLEKCLRLLFESRDVSLVRKYVERQFHKLLSGRASIQDLTFAKEYRGMAGYKPGACVPALELVRKWKTVDPRNEPRSGERVPYVIINGPPGLPLIKLVRSPRELLEDPALRPNALYYITKAIIPPINRCFLLIGADVNTWFNEMPRKHTQYLPTTTSPSKGPKTTISQYFATTSCICCGQQTKEGVCAKCWKDKQSTAVILHEKVRIWERNYHETLKICQSCCNRSSDLSCVSLDCPVLYRTKQTHKDLQQTSYVRDLIAKLPHLEF